MSNPFRMNAAYLRRNVREVPADTPPENALEAGLRRDIIPYLRDMYLFGVNGLRPQNADDEEEALIALLLLLFFNNPGLLTAFEVTLYNYTLAGVNLGGQTALGDLNLPGLFNLTSEDVKQFIRDHVRDLLDPYGDMSLVRTTSNDIAWQVVKWRRDNPDADPSLLLGALLAYVEPRTAQRADAISEFEMVQAIQVGGVMTYWRNGVEQVEFMTQRDNRVDFGDPAGPCAQLDGQYFPAERIPSYAQIPIHHKCRCRYYPVTSGWFAPETVWTGW
jgi:hypothetical protein